MSKRVRDQKPHKVQELMKSAEERSEDLKKSLRDGTLFESRKELEEKPFQIWTRQQEEMKKELQAHKKAIATIKTELGHFGVPERRLHQISKMAWTATKTDFTEAEQEERRLLVLKVCFPSVRMHMCACCEFACMRCECYATSARMVSGAGGRGAGQVKAEAGRHGAAAPGRAQRRAHQEAGKPRLQ